MAYPYYRFFPGDYLRDTRRLTLLQHGAYHLLIHEYMSSGKALRGDLDGMCRVCGALSGEERKAVEFVLAEFFTMDGPLWRHKRCDEELAKLDERSAAAVESARCRWNANAMRTHSERNANQNQNQNQNQKLEPEQEKPREPVATAPSGAQKTIVRKNGTRLPDGWELPPEWQQWAVAVFHEDPKKVFRVSLDFRDYWHAKPGKDGVKLDWQATWRRWCRKEFENA